MPQGVFVCGKGVFEISHLLCYATFIFYQGSIYLRIVAGPAGVPIRSHVCSLAALSLLMMFAGATTPLGGGGAAGAAGGDIAFVLGVRGWGIPWSCCWRGMCRWDMRVGSKGGKREH